MVVRAPLASPPSPPRCGRPGPSLPQRVDPVARVPSQTVSIICIYLIHAQSSVKILSHGSFKPNVGDSQVPCETHRRSRSHANQTHKFKLLVHHEQARLAQRSRREVHRLLLPCVSTNCALTSAMSVCICVSWRIAGFSSYLCACVLSAKVLTARLIIGPVSR